jgi:hypothetical protein
MDFRLAGPMRCIDQAATAVAALYAGFAIMPLSITAPRSDGWRYRDEIAVHVDDRRWLVGHVGCWLYSLDQRFRSSNHIMRPYRACRSRCERRDRG